jgi:hypothetical protein
MRYETAGDPMTNLRWTRKTIGKITKEINATGINIGDTTVANILKDLDYSLKSNVKKISNGGKNVSPENQAKRDVQYHYIKSMISSSGAEGIPMISCDTKKKEVVGNFKNNGTRLKKQADLVNDHDFLSYALGKAAPYGIYDIINNNGHVYVGKHSLVDKKILSGDTPEFAVECIEKWWITYGLTKYKGNKKLLIFVDAGGSNGYRNSMWKEKLQEILCNKHGLEVTVCHYPPGASKWNLIEHRLFSEISKNWKGVPLKDYETILKYIMTTTTSTGLTVDATIVDKIYEKGLKATPEQVAQLNIERHETNANWNYTIRPNGIKSLVKKSAA